MKRTIAYAWISVMAAGMVGVFFAQAEGESGQKVDPKMEAMMKKAEAAGTPGASHQALDSMVGNWNAEVKFWMAPEAPPMISKATAKSAWILNGRFVQEEFNGEFMGKPFKGISVTGFDNMKQKYSNVWIDDMHTTMFTTEGGGEEGNKVITFEGKFDCPVTGVKDTPMKQVLRVVSKDKHVFEMYDPSKGENVKTMEITYTRK